MITTNDNRRADLAWAQHLVEGQAGLVPLARPKPANPCWQALEADLRSRAAQPLLQPRVVREELQDGSVGDLDVARISRQRDPPERALALTKQRPDVGRHEAREVEGPYAAAQSCFVADRIPVVEDLSPGILEFHHRLNVA